MSGMFIPPAEKLSGEIYGSVGCWLDAANGCGERESAGCLLAGTLTGGCRGFEVIGRCCDGTGNPPLLLTELSMINGQVGRTVGWLLCDTEIDEGKREGVLLYGQLVCKLWSAT